MIHTVGSLLLSLSCSGALMIILICIISYVFRKKSSFRWQYYIWLFVIARLLLPFAPEGNLMESLGEKFEAGTQLFNEENQKTAGSGTAANQNGTKEPQNADGTNQKLNLEGNTKNFENNNQKDISANNSQDMENGSQNQILSNNGQDMENGSLLQKLQPAQKYLLIFWLVVAIFLIIRKVTVYQCFIRYIRAGSTPISDINSLETLSATEQELGIKKALELWGNPMISSPMLIGIIHPCIVLPESTLSEKAFHYTILHELIHYKRHDLIYKWTGQIVLCIHWFNPLVYIMAANISRLCEFSCDEAVNRHLSSEEGRREYAQTLLEAMKTGGNYREHLASITLSENKKILKERLEAIMSYEKMTTKKKLLVTVLTAGIFISALYTGSYTANAADDAIKLETAIEPTPETALNTALKTGAKPQSPTATLSGAKKRKNDKVTASQADKMALALTKKVWIWDWVAFYVPYMSDAGVKKLLPASKQADWAGSVDFTTGKKIIFTKKKINAARKNKTFASLTRKDIDKHALMIMQSNGNWSCISAMLPYMSHSGIDAVVRCYNSKQFSNKKHAEDYY